MKYLIVSLSFLFSVSALATQFQTTAIYCNGPVTNGDVTKCPSFSSWGGVELKNLTLAMLPLTQNEGMFRLEDSNGHFWERNLTNCQSKLTDIRGCKAVANFSDSNNISIQINFWDIGTQIQRLSVFIKNNNELSILPSGGDQLVFSLK